MSHPYQLNKKQIQFSSDIFLEAIIEKKKTASVVWLGSFEFPDDDYNSALVAGDFYQVLDSQMQARCKIRITKMELCVWRAIPEQLWRGAGYISANQFREDHIKYFDEPGEGFEFIAYYFTLEKVL